MKEEPDHLWQPSCSMEMLRLRATMLNEFRRYFLSQGYLEVETPLLSADVVVDAHIDPFPVSVGDDDVYFLQTSPEASMKRLLSAGSGSIFQVTHAFRKAECGQRHNPEFTMIEWYGLDTTYDDQMHFTRNMIRSALAGAGSDGPSDLLINADLFEQDYSRTTYQHAFHQLTDDVLNADIQDLQGLVLKHIDGVAPAPLPAQRDDLLNLLLAECIEPRLGTAAPEYLVDYPLSQAALAEQNPLDSRTARRFELYVNGLELCNGYQELTDPGVLVDRQKTQKAARPISSEGDLCGPAFLEQAMRSGLPSCSGVALGFDRLLMCLAGADHIDEVIPFPFERA